MSSQILLPILPHFRYYSDCRKLENQTSGENYVRISFRYIASNRSYATAPTEPQTPMDSAMTGLQETIENALELSLKLEDVLSKTVLRIGAEAASGQDVSAPKSMRAPLTEFIETQASKVEAFNSRLRSILSRLDV